MIIFPIINIILLVSFVTLATRDYIKGGDTKDFQILLLGLYVGIDGLKTLVFE